MITIHLHDKRYIALQNDFRHKDDIKSLAPYPEVKWDADRRMWLVDGSLMWKLISYLGEYIAPLSLDVIFEYPIPKPTEPGKKRRRTKREVMAQKAEEKEQVRKYGKAVLEFGRSLR